MLLLGTDLPFREFLPGDDVKKVQIDKNPKHIGRRTAVDLARVGHIKTTVTALLGKVRDKNDSSKPAGQTSVRYWTDVLGRVQ